MKPQLVVLAGPNGAGKSTYYDTFLGGSRLPFLNADLFAAETGVDSLEAARILDATRGRMIDDGLGFITETVFSDPHGAKLEMLRKAVTAGFDVTLVYIGVATAKLSGHRVDQRVAIGGHDVPRDRIASRFTRSLANLAAAIAFVPIVELYDNSLVDEPYRHVATFESGVLTTRMAGAVPRWARGVVRGKRH
jgi:predicted ABC-type ATPase